MKQKRAVPILLFILGSLLVVLSETSITGAVIGVNVIQLSSLFGMMLIVASLIIGASLDDIFAESQIVSPRQLGRTIHKTIELEHADMVIYDTSAFMEYQEPALRQMIPREVETYTPQSVLDELRASLRKTVSALTRRIRPSGAYREAARKFLAQTPKARLYLRFAEKIEQLEAISHLEDMGVSYTELSDAYRKLADEFLYAVQICHTMDDSRHQRHSFALLRKSLEYVKDSCQVSNADVDVLGSALTAALERDKRVILVEKDSDFEHAVLFAKREIPQLHGRIRLLNPYAV